jgi:hypothetical protein
MSILSTVFAYHERTKHHFHRYARSPGNLDWANQPHPFRYYGGATETGLELDRGFVQKRRFVQKVDCQNWFCTKIPALPRKSLK